MDACEENANLLRTALTVFFALITCVCATLQIAIAASAEESNGALVLAISTPVIDGKQDKQYIGLDLKICRQGGRESVILSNSVNNWLSSDKNDFSDPNEAGMVLLKSLPPGSWEVCSYTATNTLGNIFVPQGTALSDMFTPRDFSIPFTISQGRATYIGDFKAVGTTTKSLLGLTVPAGPRWIISNQSARDIPIAQKKDPSLELIDVTVPNVDKLSDSRFSNHDVEPNGNPVSGPDKAPPSTTETAKMPAASAPQQQDQH